MFLAPLDVVLSNHDVVEPDLLFIAGDQAGITTEKNIQGAASTSARSSARLFELR